MHHARLDVSKMDFFKIVVDDQFVYMEEASPEAEALKDMVMDNSTPKAREDEHHEA